MLSEFFLLPAFGSWQVVVGKWQLAVGRWQVAGGMCPNCLGAVRMAGIICLHQLVVKGKKRDGAAGGGVLSTFYVLMTINNISGIVKYDLNIIK